MTDSEVIRFIRQEIARAANVILTAKVESNTQKSETISNLFPGMPQILDRPVVHPYGYASRAPVGTKAVIGRHGDHFGNRIILGHRDEDRPEIDVGESTMYSVGKYQLRVFNDKIQVAKNGDFETLVVGETAVEFLIALIGLINEHKHIVTAPGSLTHVPNNVADFTSLQGNFLDNEKVLAKDGGRY